MASTAAAAQRRRPAGLPRVIEADVTIRRVGGWDSAGHVALTYEEDISGRFEVLTRGHLYNWVRGIDIYPTPEQLAALLAGQPIRGVRWA